MKNKFSVLGGFIILIGTFILILLIGPYPQYTIALQPKLAYSILLGLVFSIIGIASYWLEKMNRYMQISGILLIVLAFLTDTPIIVAPFFIIGGILYLMAGKSKSKSKKK